MPPPGRERLLRRFGVLYQGGALWSSMTRLVHAGGGDSIPRKYLEGRTALERHGALVLQLKQCRDCHALGDTCGKRGPPLDRSPST